MAASDTSPLHSNHREREILEELRLAGGSSRIQFLAERIGVSEETIRRNIRTLETNGLVTKVHGGVHLKDVTNEQPLHFRMNENAEAKRLIATKVADIIEDGDTLFLDIGSTTAFIAVALQRRQNLFVVTNSVAVAHTLATRNNNRIFFAGGELRPHDGGAFGIDSINFVRRFNVRHAILSVTAINAASGFMLQDMEEAEYSREAGRRAETRIVVADSDKFYRSAPIILDEPSAYDMLVTDAPPPADIAAMLADNRIELVVAGKAQDR
ncbi:DeoR/GlpR family DNA-binding transcription regulator [Rhizobiaceae bacterium n13]|uniref:DeoR/GlpR family DNA-binding transcription regulator n=1 Tax=Ferirhizobium litorale TaxID=2927786 RepID=A0AAE3QCM5_9HYPH|nr:DeoR/GlpR family DNA-binding transcription regulator [Fererhizobium litorale]MDI7860616.1 DeoR/GlpR family DNA-binding transcription regulator [Fererhizobium litorale]MDI7920764.1 DeoR/GlpR family DNA-binding transcription regulator [Fererhizobium litorale]